MDQWNRIKDPDINPHTYEHLTFYKEIKTIQWEKVYKWCWHNWMVAWRKMQVDSYLSPCTKFKSKWIKDFNRNTVILKLIEEKVKWQPIE